MIDQAQRLREIIRNQRAAMEGSKPAVPAPEPSRLRIITVTSGKGGVGKTNFTANLALCLQELGQRVLILDADFGLANIEVVLGVVPKYNFYHFISRAVSIRDIITEGPNGVKFISGGSGIYELAHLNMEQLNAAIQDLSEIESMFDILLIDTGAGVNDTILKFVLSSNEVIIVATPEPTSIMDAYALLKNININMALSQKNGTPSIKLLVNKAESESEAMKILTNFSDLAKKFLGSDIEQLGYILSDNSVTRSIKLHSPLMTEFPKSNAARETRRIALKLTDSSQEVSAGSLTGFFRRFTDKWKLSVGRAGK